MKTQMGIRTVNLVSDGRPAYIEIECPVCKSTTVLSCSQFTFDADGFIFPDVVCLKVVSKAAVMKRGEVKDVSYCSFAGPIRVKGLK